jgi:hypothetical protein
MALVLMPPPPIMEVATYPFFYNGVYYPAGTPVWPVSIFAKNLCPNCFPFYKFIFFYKKNEKSEKSYENDMFCRYTFVDFVSLLVKSYLCVSFTCKIGTFHAGGSGAKPPDGDFAAGQQRDGAAGETAHPGGVRSRSLPVSNILPQFA